MLHEVLTVKDDKGEPFNYNQPKVGLQIFHNTTRTGLIYKINNSTEFLFRKSICRFMLKFSRFYFQVRFCGITNKELSKWWKLASNICSTVFNFQCMKNSMELNSIFSNFFCYITWLDTTLDDLQTRPLCQILLFWGNCKLSNKFLKRI